MVKAEIAGENYTLQIDTGAVESLYLLENSLQRIQNKIFKNNIKIYDFRGRFYNWKKYLVSKIRIGPLFLSECEIIEETLDFQKNTDLSGNLKSSNVSENHGSIGWSLFKKYCTLFDFPNSSIFVAENLEYLKKDGLFKMENFIRVPFEIQDGLLVISIETELGPLKFILDTGASYRILKIKEREQITTRYLNSGEPYYISEKLMIGGRDFGPHSFALCKITDLIEADGLLGTDFFIEHSVCFDFANQLVYIEKPERPITARWRRFKFHLTQYFLRNL